MQQMYDYRLEDTNFHAWVLLHQTWFAVYRFEERQFAEDGMTPEQASVMTAYNYAPSPLTPAELSRMLFRQSQSVAGLLDRMEGQGLVRRRRKQKGQPFTEVRLTAKGEKLSRRALDANMVLARAFGSELSAKELEQFVKLLRKVRDSILEKLQVQLIQPPPDQAVG
jgi:DNA-binding MarR family transcriptional regulator